MTVIRCQQRMAVEVALLLVDNLASGHACLEVTSFSLLSFLVKTFTNMMYGLYMKFYFPAVVSFCSF